MEQSSRFRVTDMREGGQREAGSGCSIERAWEEIGASETASDSGGGWFRGARLLSSPLLLRESKVIARLSLKINCEGATTASHLNGALGLVLVS